MPDLDGNYKAEDTSDKTAEEKMEKRDDENGENDENRPSGTRKITDSTGINPEGVDEIDDDMPVMPPA